MSSAWSSIVLTCRYQTTGGFTAASPFAVTIAVMKRSKGCFRPGPDAPRHRGRTSPAARACPTVRLFRRIADQVIANRSAYPGRSIRRSTYRIRFSGSVSASRAATSAGSGKAPQRSKEERRANVASSQGGLGGIPSVFEATEDESIN